MQNRLTILFPALLLTLVILGVLGCKNDSDCCAVVDVDVQILYKNERGENLINSSADFAESNIRIYYKNGDDYEYAYNANLDSPNMFLIYANENMDSILTVFPSDYYTGNFSTTLIELNDNVVDTLLCAFDLGDNNRICRRAWLNGEEMENRFIEIVK